MCYFNIEWCQILTFYLLKLANFNFSVSLNVREIDILTLQRSEQRNFMFKKAKFNFTQVLNYYFAPKIVFLFEILT